MDRATALRNADECRRIAEQCASPIAKQNWRRMAEDFEAMVDMPGDQRQQESFCSEQGSSSDASPEY